MPKNRLHAILPAFLFLIALTETRLNQLCLTITCNYKPDINHSLFSGTIASYRSSNLSPVTEICNREEGGISAISGHPRVRQLDVCHSQKEWGRSPRLQPEASQSVPRRSWFQDESLQGGILYDQAKQLSGLNRIIRHIPSPHTVDFHPNSRQLLRRT